jgi:hypothetical protein
MLVTVNIPDELAAQAIADGSSPESYVEKLIAEKAVSPQAGIIWPRKQTREELNASLDRLAQFSDKIPILSDAQISRESMYEDHD